MFENLPHPLDDITTIIISVSAILFAMSYAYTQIKSGKSKADSDTMATLQGELSIQKEKIERIEVDNANKDKEIAKLSGKIEALSRENTELRNTLALRDPEFSTILKTFSDNLPKLISGIEQLDINANKRYDEILRCVKKGA